MLKGLAEAVLTQAEAPVEIDLRVADALNAAFAGAATEEGDLLLRRIDARNPKGQATLAAALARLSETDDIHLGSCITPGAVVIPVALALSHGSGADGSERFGQAIAAGYAAGLRLGTAIGGARSMEAGVWPTFLAAPLMAATTAAVLRGCDAEGLANTMALALAGRSGRLGKPVGNATARWLAFGRAVERGIEAAADAAAGFAADPGLVSEAWLAAQSAPHLVDAGAPAGRNGFGIADTGYKPFATARQGAAAVAAFHLLLDEESIDPARIGHVLVEVPTASHSLVSRPLVPSDRLSTLSSAAYQLAAAALAPDLLFDVARRAAPEARVLAFAERVEAKAAVDLDADWPRSWSGRVSVDIGGRTLRRQVTRLATDSGSDGAEAAVRMKFDRMAGYRPEGLRLEAGGCSDAAGRAALWQAFVSLCETRRKELDGHAHH
ncbi:MmgE/PrpD family protein [Aquibium sp. LZ166]|uniref:MmgE/PrpD family protein n=1 Tax=Aquibium pacificus TaxID=3153579 RepID=A0ABV3SG73_9HYPH